MVLINTDAYKNAYGIAYNPEAAQRVDDRNDASAYSYLPEVQRIFLRSHIYGGSHVREQRNALVFDYTSKNLVYKVITTPKLQERVFLEIISNAIDNAFKSHRMGVAAPTLDVEMNTDMVSVKSTGIPVPIDIHEYYYRQGFFGTCAELIFSVIGAGGNADDSKAKQGGGVNGIGAKLLNVFSRFFQVEIGDNIRGFKQTITWNKNMTEKVSDNIEPAYAFTDRPDAEGKFHIYPINQNERYNGENYVKVTWLQDFRKFGREYFVEEDMQLYMKYVIEASFIAKFKATFNGMELDCKTPSHFLNMLPKSLNKGALVHYEFSQSDAMKVQGATQKQIEEAVSQLQIIPAVELIILDTPGQENMHISYTNGIWNAEGGVHTDAIYRTLLDVIKQCIAGMKGMGDVDLKKLNITDIRSQCTVIINYRCDNPIFKGQDKEKLDKPPPKIQFTADDIAKIKKFQLIQVIYQIISGKILKGMAVNTGRFKGDDNFRDADWYGTNMQSQCVLIICEGKSAGSYIRQWILGTPERSNKYCYLLLRGKLLNVTGKDLLELLDEKHGNDVIKSIVKYMGLEFGVDYRTAEGAARLRYPYMYAMTDADSDGFHIQSLVENVLNAFFPTFLMSGRFLYVPTPVLRILTAPSKGKTKNIFYSMSEYKSYMERTGDNKHFSKFFKGLASGKTEFAKEDAKNSPIVIAIYDQYAGMAFDIAFGKDKDSSDKRKVWIEHCRNNIDADIIHSCNAPDSRLKFSNISDYFNTKLVEYSIDSFSRALPCAYDGLKKSQRQSIWYILVEWKYGHSRKGSVNLASIAGDAKTKTKYHHGDLTITIARMGSDYPGSNNVPLLVQEGQFGTREQLGDDIGASRYVETEPEDIVPLIFDEELTKLIPNNVVEGKDVEPKWLPSKLPLHVLNGALGVATAYSIDQPGYHPMDVCQWILNYITGKSVFPMIPWIRGFQGQTILEIVNGKRKVENDLMMNNQDYVKYYEGLTLTTMGNYQVCCERNATYEVEEDGKKKKVQGLVKDILITEIPIRIATNKYIKWLETKCDRVDGSQTTTTDTPILKVIGWKGEVNHKELRLINRQGINNISLIDNNGIPIQLRNVYEVLKLYCDNMIALYIELKRTRLSTILDKIKEEEAMVRLIELVISDKIVIFKRKRADIFTQMSNYGIDNKYYEKVGLKGLDEDGYAEHLEKLRKLKEEYTAIDQKHHLFDWCEDLGKLFIFFSKDQTYIKFQQHQYPFIETSIDHLISGKVKSPFEIKEEPAPPPLNDII